MLPSKARSHFRRFAVLGSYGRQFCNTQISHIKSDDPRIREIGRLIEDDYATIRDKYERPRNPVVLAHGLLGFDELHIAGARLPGLHYWRGITEALAANGVECIVASVPPSGSIETRAARLSECIARKAPGRSVNIIAHSMVGVSPDVILFQLTAPRGSAFADFVFQQIGPLHIPKIYKALEFFGLESDAFSQLTRSYMAKQFNPATPDDPRVRYYSYGAAFDPYLLSVFRYSHRVIAAEEGANDGMVSIDSSHWGTYKGTLQGASHLDLINWTNRLRWWFFALGGKKRNFNAVALYLDIADMLAKEGL
ncbi:hypothetical protein CAC42_8149 [Sphaceloma murrayae]|uniref:Lipase 2 n=1 Tax=Sphaceloma murrayae TaxID=2082308 RepID=A0A2K1QJ15_9PEZI|nr:hypothetical protein CAC42_8149 [Sphaceloma murrayae]